MNIRSAALGTTFLVVLLTAGAAQSLAGSNTVFTDDIVDNTVSSADVRNESLGTADVLNSSLIGGDIRNDTITGSDVNEGTLVLTCPANMVKRGHLCIGAQRTPRRLLDALDDCADENLKLPSLSESQIVVASAGTTSPEIWTDIAYYNGASIVGVTRGSHSSRFQVTWTENVLYRCVTHVGARP